MTVNGDNRFNWFAVSGFVQIFFEVNSRHFQGISRSVIAKFKGILESTPRIFFIFFPPLLEYTATHD